MIETHGQNAETVEVEILTRISLDNLHGWASAEWDAKAAEAESSASAARARALGANN